MLLLNNTKNLNETNPEFAYRVLRHNILCLLLQPGDPISENELSKILNISRTPIREAIINLKRESLIEVYPQKGTFVSHLDPTLISEASFMRYVLECEIVKLCCKNFPQDSLNELEKNLEYQKKIFEFNFSPMDFFNLDNKFHEIIFKGCNKINIWNQIKIISSHLNRLRLLNVNEKEVIENSLKEHQKIIDIIKNKDVDSINSILDEHIIGVEKRISHLKKIYPNFFVNKN